jgi:hypothetical protein
VIYRHASTSEDRRTAHPFRIDFNQIFDIHFNLPDL